MKNITPNDFKEMMQKLKSEYGNDEEAMFWKMNDLMCEVLKQNGYSEGIEIFENADKFYS